MPDNRYTATLDTPISVTRQPIFDENRRLWGYELICKTEGASAGSESALDNTAVCIAASAYMGFQQILKQGQRIMLNFDEAGLLADMPYVLPPVLAAVQVNEQVFLNPAIPGKLENLKSDGYLIALGGFSGAQQFQALYRLADIIAVPATGENKAEASSLPESIREADTVLLSRHVEDAVQFERCREMGVTLFTGSYFKQPDTITFHRLTSNAMARRKLLQCIELPDPDIDDLAEVIQSDAATSFRLLAYLNAAAFGILHNVKSIHHALGLLDWPQLRNWLRVVLLNDNNQPVDPPELQQQAARRGKFMERVARSHDFWGFDPESLHLLGLLSLLDAQLGISMDELVTYLPIENKLKNALRGETNNEYLPLLELARCVEKVGCERGGAMIQRLNLNREKVAQALQDAAQWADRLTGN
jgi:c-di-GMP phosphodiesterase